jgi:hypothetical protein
MYILTGSQALGTNLATLVKERNCLQEKTAKQENIVDCNGRGKERAWGRRYETGFCTGKMVRSEIPKSVNGEGLFKTGIWSLTFYVI